MTAPRAWFLTAIMAATSPAMAGECRSASALERQLLETKVQPFVAQIQRPSPDSPWNIAPWGGFQISATGLGDVVTLFGPMAEATTSCGLRVTWQLQWNGQGRAVSAGAFKLVEAERKPGLGSVTEFAGTTFRVTPDSAGQTAWLTVADAGGSHSYLLNFPATAISFLPEIHTDAVHLQMMGVRANGTLVYSEFRVMRAR